MCDLQFLFPHTSLQVSLIIIVVAANVSTAENQFNPYSVYFVALHSPSPQQPTIGPPPVHTNHLTLIISELLLKLYY